MEINLICSGNTIDDLTEKEIEFINSKRCIFVNKSGLINKKIPMKQDDFLIMNDGIPNYQEIFFEHKTEKVPYIFIFPNNMYRMLEMVYRIDFNNHINKTISYDYLHEGESTSAMALSYLVENGYKKINVFGLDMNGEGFSGKSKVRNYNYKPFFFERNIEFITEKSIEWNKKSNIILRTKSKLNCFEFLKIK